MLCTKVRSGEDIFLNRTRGKMWHEVRKQERRIRCMIVDYKRRAERRKDYYEKIKADPTQFLQLHGRPCKIHLDPAVAMAGDSPANMMGWQGSPDVVIDRFDVRAHLDYIQDYRGEEDEPLSYEDRHINYERYRILVQNDFLGVSEEKFLHQLYLEEQFGVVTRMPEVPNEGKKKVVGAAIAFNYDNPSATPAPPQPAQELTPEEEEDDDEDSDIDFDVCVDVNKVTTQQAHELNSSALPYGMESNDFFSFLTKDREEAETLRMAKELEEEKAMYSGRKSRRERRAYREKKLAGRIISPPSYASRKSPTYRDYTKEGSKSRSRSNSPVNSGKITYITSFGAEEPQPSSSSPKLKATPKTLLNEYSRTLKHRSRSPETRKRRSRSRSHSPHSSRRKRTKSKSPKSSWRKSPKRVYSRRSKSRTRSPRPSSSRPSDRSHSRSKSPSKNHKSASASGSNSLVKQPPPPVISRYYGRRGRSSSSELSLSDEENDKSNANNSDKKVGATIGNSSSRNKPAPTVPSSSASTGSSGAKLTPQERLKRKMQALINKQYKADKKAEREKREKVEQERIDREDEMREISIKLRKRERMRRHEYLAEYEQRRSDDSDSSRSRSSSRSHSRSKSRSPSLRSPRKREDRERRRRSRSHSRPRVRDLSARTRDVRDREYDGRVRERDYDVRDRDIRDRDVRDRDKMYDPRDRDVRDRDRNYDPRDRERDFDPRERDRDHDVRDRDRERDRDYDVRDRDRSYDVRERDRDRDRYRDSHSRPTYTRSLVDY